MRIAIIGFTILSERENAGCRTNSYRKKRNYAEKIKKIGVEQLLIITQFLHLNTQRKASVSRSVN